MSEKSDAILSYFDEADKKKLPVPGKRNILITSALPYVNNVPHLGNIIGCVLSGDVFARYCRMRGYQCLHVCGTDEYGTATEMKALKEGMTPKEICDKFHNLHKEIYEWFNIDFNFFGRTTTANQTEICQDMFLKLHQRGYVTVKSLEQLHCPNCDKFLADRFVNGTCPHCGYDDARGDQCDKCAKLLDAIQLIQPKCHGATEQYLNKVTSSKSSHWSNNAVSIARSWIKAGLEERCITRDLKWGTPVPLKGYENKVFYVWFDAPIGYLSITKSLVGDDWVKWWKNDDVELYQFVGKDNVAFHSIIFPSTQIGTGENYTMVRHLCATEYLNYEGQKFSKSRGTGVFGDAAASTGIPADVWRFYLIYMRPETQDTTFSWDDFVNSELLNNLGNFVNRALSFLSSRFDGIIPESRTVEEDSEFISDVNKILDEYIVSMENVKIRDALQHILAVSRRGNQYLQATQPWKLLKSENSNEKSVIALAANVCVVLSAMLYPFMPDTSRQIREQCGILRPFLLPMKFHTLLKPGHHIGKPAPIFTALDPKNIQVWKSKFGGSSSESQVLGQKKVQKQVGKNLVMSDLLHQIENDFEKLKVAFVSNQLNSLTTEYGSLLEEFKRLKTKIAQADNLNNVPVPEPSSQSKNSNALTQEAPPKKKINSNAPVSASGTADQADIGRLDLRIGRIVEAKRHPDADALYVETIDFGEDKHRTVISGLVKFVPLEQMQNRLVVGLCNLKPVKMRGIESQAMVMCASTAEKVEIIEVDPSAKPGDRLYVDGFEHRPDAVLNPKKKVWETCAVDLKVSDTGEAVYKGKKLMSRKAKGQKDERIEIAESNPLYEELPQRNLKVKVDKRFHAMFTDDRFSSTRSKIDRYGKPILKTTRENLSRLYEVEESTERNATANPHDLMESGPNESSDESSSSEESGSSENSDVEDGDLELHSRWGTLDHDARRVEWTSKRLAVCNMDWDQVSSEDLFASLSVAVPPGGKITKVTTYLSDYGDKALKNENEHGPNLPKLNVKKNDDERFDQSIYSDSIRIQNLSIIAYYMDRFRFFYAVVECNDEKTAQQIYQECDGMEFAKPGLRLDLRFIEDSISFEAQHIRDQCTSVNMQEYRPKHTDTMLTRSKAVLDWDSNEISRKAAISSAFNENGDLNDASALLASGSDDDEPPLDIQVRPDDAEIKQNSGAKHLEKRRLKRKMLKEKLLARKKAKESKSSSQAQKPEKKMQAKKDSRFDALYTDSRFFIDPTHSAYKGGILAQQQVKEKIKRQKVRHC